MAIAQRVAGYSLGAADLLRKAMGKKILAVLNKERGKFTAGMLANGYSEDAIETLWELLIPFASYAFNRAHSAAYGLIAYWTAYLKTHHPAEYMAALLTSTGDDKDRAALYLAECRRMGLTVLAPDVNASAAEFTAVGADGVRVGLGAVRNVGGTAVSAVLTARPYSGFHDYLRSVGAPGRKKDVVESLIKAGAFDAMGHQRGGLHQVYEAAIKAAAGVAKAASAGQLDLFSGLDAGPTVPDILIPVTTWAPKRLLAAERDMLGLYVTGHPLRGMEHALEGTAPLYAVLEGSYPDGEQVTVGGVLASVSRRYNRTGQPWAVCTLEDLAAGVEVVFFARVYERVRNQVTEDAVVQVRGRVSVRNDRITVIGDELSVMGEADGVGAAGGGG